MGEVFEKLLRMAAKENIQVIFKTFKSKADGFYIGSDEEGNSQVAICANLPFEKCVDTLAHELAHHFMHYDKGNTITNDKHDEYEEQADRAARMLLMALSTQ